MRIIFAKETGIQSLFLKADYITRLTEPLITLRMLINFLISRLERGRRTFVSLLHAMTQDTVARQRLIPLTQRTYADTRGSFR